MRELAAAAALETSYWAGGGDDRLVALTVGDALREAAREVPDRTALVAPGVDGASRRVWSYGRLLAEAEAVAEALRARFAPASRIAVWAHNVPEWVVLEYGIALAGMTLVTVNPALLEAELTHVLSHSGAHGVFLVDEYRGSDLPARLARVAGALPAAPRAERISELAAFVAGAEAEAERSGDAPEPAPRDPAQIQYTSGTTGRPKGAVLHHHGVVNNARAFAERFGLEPASVVLSPMPLFHTAGCVLSVLGPLAARATLVLPPAFDPEQCLALIERERVDSLLAVPTMLLALLEHPRAKTADLTSLRRVMSGGAVVPPSLVDRVERELGATCTVAFAQTEASPVITQSSADDSARDRRETLGRPLDAIEVKIADPGTGAPVAIGAVGEIQTRGFHVMTGYLDEPDKTAATIDADGWLRTGDLGSMDARGFCRIEGRLKEMIIRGGENIYPREIEQVLVEHPDVLDAAVVGVPDPHWGESVAAFVRPRGGAAADEAALSAYCRERLAAHKTPRRWVFVDDLPLTGSGKVRKHVLRDRLVAQDAAQPR